jgi:hypothetical protein
MEFKIPVFRHFPQLLQQYIVIQKLMHMLLKSFIYNIRRSIVFHVFNPAGLKAILDEYYNFTIENIMIVSSRAYSKTFYHCASTYKVQSHWTTV